MKVPWSMLIFVSMVIVLLDRHGTWQHLATWKKLYLESAGGLLAACMLLDGVYTALAKRRKRQ